MTTRHIYSNSRNGKQQQRLKTAGNDRSKRNALNHIVDSQAARIDSCLYHGCMSIKQIQAFAGSRTKQRVRNHFRHLAEKHDIQVQEINGKCKIVV